MTISSRFPRLSNLMGLTRRAARAKPSSSRFPLLSNLMGAHFNQDFGLDGLSEIETLQAFARCLRTNDQLQVLAEIDAMLEFPVTGLLQRYAELTGPWDMLIGDDDQSAREWLMMAREVVAETKPYDE